MAASFLTVPELAARLLAEKAVTVHPASLSRFLRVQGFSFKKTLLASETDRDDVVRARRVWAELFASYQISEPKLATRLEQNVPEGLTVFSLPETHQKRMRMLNPIERSIQQEVKRRTVKVRVFPSEDSLLRLVSAILVEIDEKWAGQQQPYINWDHQNA